MPFRGWLKDCQGDQEEVAKGGKCHECQGVWISKNDDCYRQDEATSTFDSISPQHQWANPDRNQHPKDTLEWLRLYDRRLTFTVAIQCMSAASAWTVASHVCWIICLVSSIPKGPSKGPCHAWTRGNTVSTSYTSVNNALSWYRNWESRHWKDSDLKRLAFLKTCLQDACHTNMVFIARSSQSGELCERPTAGE